MSFALPELVLIGVILLVIGDGLAVAIVGIVKAVGRKQQGRRSTGAVIWSSVNVGLFAVMTVGTGIVAHTPPIVPAAFCVLNGVWLYLAVQANRAAAARPSEIP